MVGWHEDTLPGASVGSRECRSCPCAVGILRNNIEAQADAVFKVPAAVEFKDGDSEATLSVACPDLQALQSYQFSIHLD